MACASSSLPVPLSPVISTEVSLEATWRASSSSWRMIGVPVTSSLRHSSPFSGASPVVAEISSARRTSDSSASRSTGLVRKLKAPFCVAATASGIVPCAVSRITGSP
jgi:hypothetical protein